MAAKRLNQWQKASARPGHRQQLMVLIAEIKAIDAARYGHKMVLKHLPDAPLFLDDRLHRRLKRAFALELDLWAADETSHLVVIATFTVGRGGAAMAEEVALMPTTAQWLPYQDPYAKVLLDRLVDTQRRFRTTPRFSLPPTVDLPIAVLTDTREPTPLHLGHTQGLSLIHICISAIEHEDRRATWTPNPRDPAWPSSPPRMSPVSYTHLDVYKRQAR